jgi:xanthine dehydrogenase large subunit
MPEAPSLDQNGPPRRRRSASAASVHDSRRHDSAHKHVAAPPSISTTCRAGGLLHVARPERPRPCRIRSIDLGRCARPRRRRGLTAADVPGATMSAGLGDEPLFADRLVEFGQPIFAVAAETRDAGPPRRAAGRIEYEGCRRSSTSPPPPAASWSTTPMTLKRGDADAAIAARPAPAERPMRSAARSISISKARSPGMPGEDGEVTVHCSTQHPSEVQHIVAHVLASRRMP